MKLVISIILFMTLLSNIDAQDFPSSWIGNYSGNLEIYAVDSIARNIKMDLNIQPTTQDSVFSWEIVYHMDSTQQDVRKYELIIKDESKGMYEIDEKNGIIIDAFLKKDILTSFFSVMNNFIIATYTKIDNGVVFEIIFANTKSIRTSGDTKNGDENIPKVDAFLVGGRQKAVLVKM